MSDLKGAAITFGLFIFLAWNTAYHPFEKWDIHPRALIALDDLINFLLVSWLGVSGVIAVLVLLSVLLPWRVLTRKRRMREAR